MFKTSVPSAGSLLSFGLAFNWLSMTIFFILTIKKIDYSKYEFIAYILPVIGLMFVGIYLYITWTAIKKESAWMFIQNRMALINIGIATLISFLFSELYLPANNNFTGSFIIPFVIFFFFAIISALYSRVAESKMLIRRVRADAIEKFNKKKILQEAKIKESQLDTNSKDNRDQISDLIKKMNEPKTDK